MNLQTNINTNISSLNPYLKDCDDIKSRTMLIEKNLSINAIIYYVEVTISNTIFSDSVIGEFLAHMITLSHKEQISYLENNSLGIADVQELSTIEEVLQGIMTGDTIFLMDGYDKALKISAKGYPNMGITASENEKSYKGTKESFSDSVKQNSALLRKRIRNTDLKIKEKTIGTLSNTTIAIVYVESLTRTSVLDEINHRLDKLSDKVESLTDAGILEQLTEENYFSPFPQYQSTERPDNATMALTEGRVILLVDNSPTALILPTSYNNFFKTADDYFSRYYVATLARFIRYIAAFLAVTLPGLYITALLYHPEIIPQRLLIALYSARESVPFSVVMEVLIMEFAFELIREAGIRIPGSIGSTIGIVGGLIIGDASVSAGIASPIIVVVVSLTALASFAIPSKELAGTFRILKYMQIVFAYTFGIFGLILGWMLIFMHLCKLNSFNFPYLSQSVAREIYHNSKDSILRVPLKSLNKKNIFRRPHV